MHSRDLPRLSKIRKQFLRRKGMKTRAKTIKKCKTIGAAAAASQMQLTKQNRKNIDDDDANRDELKPKE